MCHQCHRVSQQRANKQLQIMFVHVQRGARTQDPSLQAVQLFDRLQSELPWVRRPTLSPVLRVLCSNHGAQLLDIRCLAACNRD